MCQILHMNILICIIWISITTHGGSVIGENHWYRLKRQKNTTTKTTVSTTETTTTIRSTTSDPELLLASKILLEGPVYKVSKLPFKVITKAIKLLKDLNIMPPQHLKEVWNLVKGKKPLESLVISDLKKMQGFLRYIPDSDLYYLNMSDWDLVEYLGKTRFKTHEVAVLGAALMKANNYDTFMRATNLNRLYGLICGMDLNVISMMNADEASPMTTKIFQNLYACSKPKKRVLLKMAIQPTLLGPPQVWNAETVATASMLLLAMTPKELRSIRPRAMEGLTPLTLRFMSTELIAALKWEQVAHLSKEAYLVYLNKMHLRNKQIPHNPNITCIVLMLFSVINLEKER